MGWAEQRNKRVFRESEENCSVVEWRWWYTIDITQVYRYNVRYSEAELEMALFSSVTYLKGPSILIHFYRKPVALFISLSFSLSQFWRFFLQKGRVSYVGYTRSKLKLQRSKIFNLFPSQVDKTSILHESVAILTMRNVSNSEFSRWNLCYCERF